MAKSNLQIEVTETTNNGERIVQITITGAAEEFLLADLLAKRKKIEPITKALKHSAQEAIEGYLETAEQVIDGVNPEQKKDATAITENMVKRGRKRNSSEDNLELATLATRVNGAATTESVLEN